MGLFSKKKEQKPVPRPLPPFMNNSNQDNSNQLKDQLTSNQSNLSMEPTTLPKLPELNENNNIQESVPGNMPSMDNINTSLENANQKMTEINDRMNNMNTMSPQNNNQNDVSVFIRVDKYNEVIKTVNNMEHKINELRHTISKLTEIRNNEQKLIDSWNSLIQEAENRIQEVTSKLPPAKK
tara:strand:+ start:621 stop:1163 length:543 start_codon:yes stop_codon:yes gene_type:complete